VNDECAINVEEFWRIVAESRQDFDPGRRDGNMDRQATRLAQLLSASTVGEVIEFDRIFTELFHRAYRWDLWRAAYLIESGCSDDGFTDFRYWLISMGRDVFEAALADPDSLASVAAAPGIEVCAFEEFGSVPASVLEQKGVNMDEHAVAPWPSEPVGERWGEDDSEFASRLPKLWAKFGKR